MKLTPYLLPLKIPEYLLDRLKRELKTMVKVLVRVSPHTFRHIFAKMNAQNGANIFVLLNMLGHYTLNMVRKYVNCISHEVAEHHKKFSPIEKLF